MASYITTEDMVTHGFQIADRDDARLEVLCEMTSRVFDQACGLQANYFATTESGATSATRYFYGDGTEFLRLDPYSAFTSAALPTGYTTPTYIEYSGQTLRADGATFGLIRTYGDYYTRVGSFLSGASIDDGAAFNQFYSPIGWPEGVRVTVVATWGFSAVPADVRMAVAEMAIMKMRGMDPAYARVTNLEGVVVADALPPTAKMIADRYNNSRVNFA